VSRRQLDIRAHTPAAPAVVFGLLAEGASWPRWSPIESFQLERPGDPPPEGPGAIRVFRRGRTTGRDQLVEVVPGRRLGDVSLSGLPVRDDRATVDLQPTRDGTAIRWQAWFLPRIPGTGPLLERGLGRFLDQCARGLAAHTAGAPSPPDATP
jgi:Polyketide cyclase / dehydrase and lipid transport